MPPAPRPLEERLWSKVYKTDGCWEWQGHVRRDGYGMVWDRTRGRPVYAHRAAYELSVGAIPDGLNLDHLCRNPCCVNPAHLEAVTQAENFARGESPGAVAARTGLCERGHSDWYYRPDRPGYRQCRECRRERRRDARKRIQAVRDALRVVL